MKVTIVGPNLPDQSKGSFHVHKEGCADLKRGMMVRAERWTVEVKELDEVVYAVYSDMIEDGEDIGMYRDDIHFAPCMYR